MSPPVFVIILNWNGTADTLAAIASIEQQDYPNRHIVVVDNGSEKASVAALLKPGRSFHLIRNAINRGFAGGCNTGIDYALTQGAAYIWLFNSDASAPTDMLRILVETAEEDKRVGLVAPLMRDLPAPHQVINSCARFDRRTLIYNYTDDVDTMRAWHKHFPDQVALMGAALLIRRAVVEQIGGFDEALFAYWEDIDYSIRSSAAGFLNRLVKETALLHPAKYVYDRPGSVRPYYHYYMSRNEILLLRKHGAGLRGFKALRWATLQQLRNIERLRNDEPAAHAALAGMWDGWLNRGGPFSPRRRMPQPYRTAMARYPALLRQLLGG
ncbi:MAG TPA: glycosyltransferase family 2 protein [Rhodopila sp.]|nr:glycosyltransferase family 2 protein [Rhodopila sp.]